MFDTGPIREPVLRVRLLDRAALALCLLVRERSRPDPKEAPARTATVGVLSSTVVSPSKLFVSRAFGPRAAPLGTSGSTGPNAVLRFLVDLVGANSAPPNANTVVVGDELERCPTIRAAEGPRHFPDTFRTDHRLDA